MIQEYLSAYKAAQAAAAKLASAEIKLGNYMADESLNEVKSEGFIISRKESKRSRIKSSEEIQTLTAAADEERRLNAAENAEQIYDLQSKIYNLQLEIHNLVNNENTKALDRLVEVAEQELKESQASKYIIDCKFDVKSAALSKYIDEKALRKYVILGKNLKEECGRGISKAEVVKMAIAWSHNKSAQTLDEAWADRVAVHKSLFQ